MNKEEKKLNVGGQAVIEGVMMRSPNYWAVAVRKPNGEIEVKKDKLKALSEKTKFFKMPIIRGVIMLISALVLGIKALNYSASVAFEDEEEENMPDWQIYLTIGFAFAIASFSVTISSSSIPIFSLMTSEPETNPSTKPISIAPSFIISAIS